MKKIWIWFSALVGILAGLTALVQFYKTVTLIDLNGQWIVKNTVTEGSYKGSVIEFNVYLIQNGKTFSGEGEKTKFNAQALNSKEKSRIEIKNGIIESDTVRAIFIEHGRLRETRGSLVWRYIQLNQMKGTFSSTTSASGISTAYRTSTK